MKVPGSACMVLGHSSTGSQLLRQNYTMQIFISMSTWCAVCQCLQAYRDKEADFAARQAEYAQVTAERDEVRDSSSMQCKGLYTHYRGSMCSMAAVCNLFAFPQNCVSASLPCLSALPVLMLPLSAAPLLCLSLLRLCITPAATRQVRGRYDALRKSRLDGFMAGFNAISLKLKEMYQMITLGGDAELELVDTLDPFSEVSGNLGH